MAEDFGINYILMSSLVWERVAVFAFCISGLMLWFVCACSVGLLVITSGGNVLSDSLFSFWSKVGMVDSGPPSVS